MPGAWAVRFGLSAIGRPWWLMIGTIGLHGFAFAFFFVVAQMYVDRAAGPDIKATAQNLLIFIIYGLGTIVGSVLTGYIRDLLPRPVGQDLGRPVRPDADLHGPLRRPVPRHRVAEEVGDR